MIEENIMRQIKLMEEMQIWSMTDKIQRTEIKYQLTIQQQHLKFLGKSGIAKKGLYMSFRVHLEDM